MDGREEAVRYRFEGWLFDPASGDLAGPGGRARLAPQPSLLLRALLEEAGEVVSRKRLQERIWPEHLVRAFDEVKDTLDPLGIMNPGVIRPVDGMKFWYGSSALMRHSIAAPLILISSCFIFNFCPAATLICSLIKSTPVTISVTGCSTWIRVFISMK